MLTSQYRRILLICMCFATGRTVCPATAQEVVTIDAKATAKPFPHFWEQMFGSGRAILTLRESYRDDLRAVKQITDFKYVRFHAILHDEVGVYTEDEQGNPLYNFAYVDQIYDGLLKNGVRPIVEISFMPKKLAFNPDALHPFWYKQNVSPPKSMERWDGLMKAFAQHLIDRYGIDEVSQWYFEVWNEPNIDFWDGIPREQSYYELYAHTARALKAVHPKLRVGGPATAAAHWIHEFLKYTSDNHVPVDFVSTHGYADDTPEDMLQTTDPVPMDDRVCRAVAKVRGEIEASATPGVPLFWTEWNVEGLHESRDTIFVGPALANTVRACEGNVQQMSFWTFSDVFEEGGPIPRPFEGHFGLRAEGGINKPSFYAFELLHQLGDEVIGNASKNIIVSRDATNTWTIAAWNLVDPDQVGTTRQITLDFHGFPDTSRVTIQRVDGDHGNVLKQYAAMGSPAYPTKAQVDELNKETALPAAEVAKLRAGKLDLTLTPNALLLIRVKP